MAIKTLSIKGTDSRDVARQAREALAEFPVSYTHLTLPTIYSV